MTNIKKFIVSLIIISVISCVPVSPRADLVDMPRDINSQMAVLSILGSDDFSITVLGSEVDVKKSDFNYTYSDNIQDIYSAKSYKSIWIMGNKCIELLRSQYINIYESYLDLGYSIYFFGVKDLHILNRLFSIKIISKNQLTIRRCNKQLHL